MPDLKISQLPAATTPLAGTELVPIVQSGTTDKVTVADLTAGRAVSASALTASSGNLTFSGTAQRITGDMSNATVANRLAFQSSTTNGNTAVGLLPNGTSLIANLNVYANSDPTNASFTQVGASGTAGESFVAATRTGTGTFLPMTFYTGGSERMRIDTSGNVGIGTASPSGKLQSISASATAPALLAGDGGTLPSLPAGTQAAFYGSLGNTTYGTRIGLLGGSNGVVRFFFGDEIAAEAGFIDYSNTSEYLSFGTATTERMRIDSSGNVGIGTASPTAALDVVGAAIFTRNGKPLVLNPDYVSAGTRANISTGTGMALAFSTNGDSNERMRITSAGNIVAGASAALATTATDGFLYVPTCAGTPTGVPTAITGMAPIVVDTTNNKLYFYSGGAWRDAGP